MEKMTNEEILETITFAKSMKKALISEGNGYNSSSTAIKTFLNVFSLTDSFGLYIFYNFCVEPLRLEYRSLLREIAKNNHWLYKKYSSVINCGFRNSQPPIKFGDCIFDKETFHKINGNYETLDEYYNATVKELPSEPVEKLFKVWVIKQKLKKIEEDFS